MTIYPEKHCGACAYASPELDITSVSVEMGFCGSGDTPAEHQSFTVEKTITNRFE